VDHGHRSVSSKLTVGRGPRMSVRATRWGWEQQISATEKLVLLELCDRINDKRKKDICWPSQEMIAKRTGFEERTVNSALKRLQARGLINRQRRMIRGQRTSDMITVLIDGPTSESSAAAPPTDAGPRPAASDVLLPEANSGGNLNVVAVATGTTFSLIYKDETSRRNQSNRPFFLEFFEPGRPDLDALTYAARTIEELSPQLGIAIDWEAPGINNLQSVVEWLKQIEERRLTSCLTQVARRNVTSGGMPIRSWAYFEAEVSKLLAGPQDTGSSTKST
jgi:Helix-turn-helix domain